MMREELVFGPIRSRRLGSSLGINVLPEKGKLCNFDCIYCECGWNRDGMGDRKLPTAQMLREALGAKLQECAADGIGIDSITFSGDGEPTLNPEFPQMVDVTLELRDRFFPECRVAVLSNATMVWKDEVFQALSRVERPIMKIDAPTTALARLINKPWPGYSVEKVVESLKRFNGRFVLQTMFLKSGDFDSSAPEVLDGWMDIVRMLRPRKIMVYTIDRETPQKGLVKFTAEEMASLVSPLAEEGFDIMIKD